SYPSTPKAQFAQIRNAESSPAQQRNLPSLLAVTIHVTKPFTSREMPIPLDARDTKLDSGKGISKTQRPSPPRSSRKKPSDYSLSNPTRAEQARICNRGRRFEITLFAL